MATQGRREKQADHEKVTDQLLLLILMIERGLNEQVFITEICNHNLGIIHAF